MFVQRNAPKISNSPNVCIFQPKFAYWKTFNFLFHLADKETIYWGNFTLKSFKNTYHPLKAIPKVLQMSYSLCHKILFYTASFAA